MGCFWEVMCKGKKKGKITLKVTLSNLFHVVGFFFVLAEFGVFAFPARLVLKNKVEML